MAQQWSQRSQGGGDQNSEEPPGSELTGQVSGDGRHFERS
jgi:hypothetical protein